MVNDASGNGPTPIAPHPRGNGTSRKLALARRARAGDTLALEALVRMHRPILRRLLCVRMGLARGELEALDLIRDLVLFPSPLQPEPRTEPGVSLWLCELLEERIRAQVERPGATRASEMPAHGEPDSRTLDAARLDACLARLDRRERDVILLRDYLGASWDEVCVELDLPPPRAHELHLRARLHLARRLGQGSEQGP